MAVAQEAVNWLTHTRERRSRIGVGVLFMGKLEQINRSRVFCLFWDPAPDRFCPARGDGFVT